jgi:hypothetical protein
MRVRTQSKKQTTVLKWCSTAVEQYGSTPVQQYSCSTLNTRCSIYCQRTTNSCYDVSQNYLHSRRNPSYTAFAKTPALLLLLLLLLLLQ